MSQYYSRRHWAQFAPRQDTPREIEDRKRRNAVYAQVKSEVAARYPAPLTTETAVEALEWQERRMEQLLSEVR